MLLMMQMSLRIGEVCGLQWGDFDLQNGIRSVRRTVKRIYMAPGKTTLVNAITQNAKLRARHSYPNRYPQPSKRRICRTE